MASELIKEIRENAEVRDEVRRLILTDELLNTPETVADIQKTQRTMVETLSAVQKTQSTMANLLEKVESRFGWARWRVGWARWIAGWARWIAGWAKWRMMRVR